MSDFIVLLCSWRPSKVGKTLESRALQLQNVMQGAAARSGLQCQLFASTFLSFFAPETLNSSSQISLIKLGLQSAASLTDQNL